MEKAKKEFVQIEFGDIDKERAKERKIKRDKLRMSQRTSSFSMTLERTLTKYKMNILGEDT